MGERLNEPTVYIFAGGRQLRSGAIRLGAKTTYSTKKIEFFSFPNGRKFLLEPDREFQVNLGFQPGLNRTRLAPLLPIVGKNSNVRSHWNLSSNEFDKIEVTESRAPGTISVLEAVELLGRLSE